MSRHDWTRRGFLASLLAPAAMATAHKAIAQERGAVPVEPSHHHVSPSHAKMATEGAKRYTREQIEAAMAMPVSSLKGLQPDRFLTEFDRGRVSTLPDGRTLREYDVVAEDREIEVAPGIFFPAWTYNGTVPGPTLRCTAGDRVRIRFRNRSISEHTMHFHGIHSADMDGVAEVVKPGDEYIYEFDARPWGLQLYHCHVPPVGLHMNRGLYGAFIIDPPTPRPEARELVIVASGWDLDFDERNELYVLNGGANFYRDNPIEIRKGERVRLYYVNALEFDPVNSLHLHATFFRDLRRTPKGESEEYTDIVLLSQADRRILEFEYEYEGLYMFHAHQNRYAELGGMGHFRVRG